MRITPIAPVVHLRNDAGTNSDQRQAQKEAAESVVVELGTHKSRTGVSRLTADRVREHIKWLESL